MNARALRAVFAGAVVNRAGAFVFPFLALYFHEQRGFAMDAVGLLLAIGAGGLLAGNLVGGWAADRFRPKPVLLAALVLNAAGFALLGGLEFGLPSSALVLFGAYAGTGMFNPAANTLIADLTPAHRRARAYTSLYVCGNLGMAVGPLLGGILASLSYRWLFVGDIASSLAAAALIAACVPAHARHASSRAEEQPATLGQTLRSHPRVLAFGCAYFFLIAPLMAFEFTVPLYVKTVFQASEAWVGIIYTINAVTILLASHAIERRVRGRSPHRLMVLAALLWGAGIAFFAAGFALAWLVGVTVIWTLGEIVASIAAPTYVSRSVPDAVRGRFLSIQDAMRSVASMVCPLVLGAVWAAGHTRAIAAWLVLLPLVGALVYGALGIRSRAPAAESGVLAAGNEAA